MCRNRISRRGMHSFRSMLAVLWNYSIPDPVGTFSLSLDWLMGMRRMLTDFYHFQLMAVAGISPDGLPKTSLNQRLSGGHTMDDGKWPKVWLV